MVGETLPCIKNNMLNPNVFLQIYCDTVRDHYGMKKYEGWGGQLLTKITFFERFERDILSGAKTITLRDEAESHVTVGQVLPVSTFETDRWFCDIQILEVKPLALSDLNQAHAEQENMTLVQLRLVIAEIYPGLEQLFMIRFKVFNPTGESHSDAS